MKNSMYEALRKGAEAIIKTAAEELKNIEQQNGRSVPAAAQPPTKEALQKGADLINVTLSRGANIEKQQQIPTVIRQSEKGGRLY